MAHFGTPKLLPWSLANGKDMRFAEESDEILGPAKVAPELPWIWMAASATGGDWNGLCNEPMGLRTTDEKHGQI